MANILIHFLPLPGDTEVVPTSNTTVNILVGITGSMRDGTKSEWLQ